MALHLDHVAFAGRDLDALRSAATDVGLPTAYGGEHGTGTTHMAVVGFPDGSYLELIGPTAGTDPMDAGFWPGHLAADAGPAGWCLDVPRVADEAKRAIDADVRVDGPHEASRTRPDGTLVEWEMCFEGPDEDERLPFVIADRTPREYRVTTHPDLADGPLTGVGRVVLAVRDREASASLFARRHRLATPVSASGPFEGFTLVPGSPLGFVAASDSQACGERIERVGEGPCAYLLGTDDYEAASARFSLTDAVPFGPDGERRVAWFDHETFRGRLGVVTQ
jgi:hypothetical protein